MGSCVLALLGRLDQAADQFACTDNVGAQRDRLRGKGGVVVFRNVEQQSHFGARAARHVVEDAFARTLRRGCSYGNDIIVRNGLTMAQATAMMVCL